MHALSIEKYGNSFSQREPLKNIGEPAVFDSESLVQLATDESRKASTFISG
jgi:hypothetical protein